MRIRHALSQVRVAAPNTVGLFGGVYEQEKERESARGGCTLVDRQIIDMLQQIVETSRSRLTVTASARGDAQPLHDLECILALQPPNDAAKCGSEPADVFVKRKVFFSRRGRGWHGVKIPQGDGPALA